MSAKLPLLSCGEECAALSKAGFTEISGRGKGSHVFLYREEPATGITVPDYKEVKRGTLRAILRRADLTFEEFVDLL